MRRLLSRTSITIDEAVSILLGRTTGPVDLAPIDGADEADVDIPAFCVKEALEDELDVLDGEYRSAKHDEQPEHVIAERLAALQRQEALIEQANLYLCAIQDELNKGEQSMLKLDRSLSNAVYPFITLHSFDEWRKCLAGTQPGVVAPAETALPSLQGQKKAPRDKGIRQQDAILAEMRKQKLDPKSLPPNRHGCAGVKTAIRAEIRGSPLFEGPSTFDNAWEELVKFDQIAYAADPPPNRNMKEETS